MEEAQELFFIKVYIFNQGYGNAITATLQALYVGSSNSAGMSFNQGFVSAQTLPVSSAYFSFNVLYKLYFGSI
jgi:hypothetical protein